MLELDIFEPVHSHHDIDEERHRYISKLVKNWQCPIQQALTRLAHRLWPAKKRLLGLLPLKTYRLRSLEIDPVTYVWWVEHDLETDNKGHCEAYGVKLALDVLGQPVVTVQSGDTTYPVASFTDEALEATLAQAGCDTPLIICKGTDKA